MAEEPKDIKIAQSAILQTEEKIEKKVKLSKWWFVVGLGFLIVLDVVLWLFKVYKTNVFLIALIPLALALAILLTILVIQATKTEEKTPDIMMTGDQAEENFTLWLKTKKFIEPVGMTSVFQTSGNPSEPFWVITAFDGLDNKKTRLAGILHARDLRKTSFIRNDENLSNKEFAKLIRETLDRMAENAREEVTEEYDTMLPTGGYQKFSKRTPSRLLERQRLQQEEAKKI